MPYRYEYFDAETVLTHQGVTVYAAYDEDDLEPSPLAYWYVLDPNHCLHDETAFDIRDLALGDPALCADRPADHAAILTHAIATGQLDAAGNHL